MQKLPAASNLQSPPSTPYDQIPLHLKIQPLLLRYYLEKKLDEYNYQKSIHDNSTAVRTVTNQVRRSSARFIKRYVKTLVAQDSLLKLFYFLRSSFIFENAYLYLS